MPAPLLQPPPSAETLLAGWYNRESKMASKADRDRADDSGAREALDEAEAYEQQVREAKARCERGEVIPEELMLLMASVKGWTSKAQAARKRAEHLATPSPLAGLPDAARDVPAVFNAGTGGLCDPFGSNRLCVYWACCQ